MNEEQRNAIADRAFAFFDVPPSERQEGLAAISAWWRRLICRHEWTPVHHSYRCDRCGKIDREY